MILGIDFDLIFAFVVLILICLGILDLWRLAKFIRQRFKKKSEVIAEINAQPKPKLMGLIPVSRPVHKVFRFLYLHFLVIGLAGAILALVFVQNPSIQKSTPSQNGVWEDFTKPIEITFNMPVATRKLNPHMSSETIAGSWEYAPYLGFIRGMTRVARFYPSRTIMPEQRLVVYMTGVSRYGIEEDHEHALEFDTPSMPEVAAVTPGHTKENVDPKSEIRFTMNQRRKQYARINFEIEPKIDVQIDTPDVYSYVIKPKDGLDQSTSYSIRMYSTAVAYDVNNGDIIDQTNQELIHNLQFSTVRAPLVRNFAPKGTGIMPEEKITIQFDIDMDSGTQQFVQVSPATTVGYSWLSPRILQLVPSPGLKKDTKYTVTLPPGLLSATGGKSEEEVKFNFHTIGKVQVSEFSPRNGSVRVPRQGQKIRVAFDQPVDKASAQSKFGITPSVSGKFSWEKNTMIFTPSQSLAFDRTYTITIAKGVKSIYGIDSNKIFTSKFSTVSQNTIIRNLGLIYQTQNFTCNVTSTRMILASRGLYVSDSQIINLMGRETRSYTCNQNGGPCYWGDPNKLYIGDPNGHGAGTFQKGTHPGKGYGVYWNPVQRVLSHYGINSKLYRNWSLSGLASEIAAGHPVIIWWYNGVSGGNRMDWRDFDTGQSIYAINGMHSIVVIGFSGDVSNPTSFTVLDPWWGNQVYSRDKFNWQWPYFQNTGLAIY